MGFGLRSIAADMRFSETVSLNVLEPAIPQATVDAVVVTFGFNSLNCR